MQSPVGILAAIVVLVFGLGISIYWANTERASQTQFDIDSDSPESSVAELSSRSSSRVPETPKVQIPDDIPSKLSVIKFPDGREITVELKPRQQLLPYFHPVSRLMDVYEQLESAALGGHPKAALQLYQSLKACQFAHRSKEDLDDALESLHNDHLVVWPKGIRESREVPSGVNYQVFEDTFVDNFNFCGGVTQAHIDNYQYWARAAVDAGDYYGTRFLTEELGQTEESYELWKNEWDKGHINAATALILLYRDGIPEHLNGVPDYVTTYAYQLVRNKIVEAAEVASGNTNAGKLQAYDNVLRATGGFLSPQEQEKAEQLAFSLLEANDQCCFGSWRWD